MKPVVALTLGGLVVIAALIGVRFFSTLYHLKPGEQAAHASAAGFRITLAGALPEREARGVAINFRLNVYARPGNGREAAVLDFRGLDAWRVVRPAQGDHYENVGYCRGPGDAVPFFLHAEHSAATYIQVPSDECIVDLKLVPRYPGKHELNLSVFRRIVLTSNGMALPPAQWDTLRGTRYRSTIPGESLSWGATVS